MRGIKGGIPKFLSLRIHPAKKRYYIAYITKYSGIKRFRILF